MKIFTKATLLSLAVAVLCALLAVVSFAGAQESIVILVGETVNPDTGTPYTLEEAWAEAEEYGKEYTEVVLMTDNASYTESLALVNQEGKKTTLRLCENTSTLNNLIVLKGCELTIDVSVFWKSFFARTDREQASPPSVRCELLAKTKGA